MEHTISKMAKSAETIGKRKFKQMSSKRQHALLAALAKETLERGMGLEQYTKRYHDIQSWTELDQYFPPSWLSREEVLSEYFVFHSSFSPSSGEQTPNDEMAGDSLSWEPVFDIEVAFDQVRSPYNVGSILRIIDNLGLKGLVHSSPWLKISHPRLVKAARGCQNWIPVQYVENLPEYLSQIKVPIVGIENESHAVSVDKWEPPDRCILVVGNEEYGIADSIRSCCGQTVRIPMLGYKKSMNVHHALAITAFKVIQKYR